METPLEHKLTHAYKPDMIQYVLDNPLAFEETIQLALLDKQPYSKRAAWLLWSCMEDNDKRITPHIENMIQVLPEKCESQQRDIIYVLEKMELSEDQEGKLYDFCVNTWEQVCKKQSLRYCAFRIIIKIFKKYPDLASEIKMLTENQYIEMLTPGAYNAVLKMTKDIR